MSSGKEKGRRRVKINPSVEEPTLINDLGIEGRHGKADQTVLIPWEFIQENER